MLTPFPISILFAAPVSDCELGADVAEYGAAVMLPNFAAAVIYGIEVDFPVVPIPEVHELIRAEAANASIFPSPTVIWIRMNRGVPLALCSECSELFVKT